MKGVTRTLRSVGKLPLGTATVVLAATQVVVAVYAWKLRGAWAERDRLQAKVQTLEAWAEWVLAREQMEGGRVVGIAGIGHLWKGSSQAMPLGRYVPVVLVSGDDCAECVRSLLETCLETFQSAVDDTSSMIVVTDSAGAVVHSPIFTSVHGFRVVVVPSVATVIPSSEPLPTPSVALVDRRTGIVIWACPYQLGRRARSRFFTKARRLLTKQEVR